MVAFGALGLGLLVAFFAFCGVCVVGPTACQALPLPDYNEPNNNFAEATALENGVTQWGAIQTLSDKDYFYIDLPSRSEVSVEFQTDGNLRDGRLAFQLAGSDMIADLDWEQYDDDGSFYAHGTLPPGRLFVIVQVGRGTPNNYIYTVTVNYTEAPGPNFQDVKPGDLYYDAVTYLADRGVVSGLSSTQFGVNQLVKRQQFAKMIVKGAGFPVSTSDICPFTDVQKSEPGKYMDPNDPLYPDHYIAVAAKHHITEGVGNNRFDPYGNITLAQVVTMVVRAGMELGVWDEPPHSYVPPFAPFGEPHYSYARMAAAHGVFVGYSGDYNWYAPATRGQCAFFIWKLMLAYQVGAY